MAAGGGRADKSLVPGRAFGRWGDQRFADLLAADFAASSLRRRIVIHFTAQPRQLRGHSLETLVRVEFLRVGAHLGCSVGDRPVHPFAQGQAVAASRFLRRLAYIEINALDAPGNRLVHFKLPG